MLINTRVVWARNPNTGSEGWRIKRIPSFDPVANATGLTHDILEHARNDKGTWAEEVQAYGAIIAWRMDASDNLFKRLKLADKPKALGQELGDFLDDWMNADTKSIFDVQIKKVSIVPPVVSEVAIAACEYVNDRYGNIEDALDTIISLLMLGYKRATKVIEESGYHPSDLWSTVHDQINMYMFKQEYIVGTEVSIQIDTGRCWCRVLPIRGYQF